MLQAFWGNDSLKSAFLRGLEGSHPWIHKLISHIPPAATVTCIGLPVWLGNTARTIAPSNRDGARGLIEEIKPGVTSFQIQGAAILATSSLVRSQPGSLGHLTPTTAKNLTATLDSAGEVMAAGALVNWLAREFRFLPSSIPRANNSLVDLCQTLLGPDPRPAEIYEGLERIELGTQWVDLWVRHINTLESTRALPAAVPAYQPLLALGCGARYRRYFSMPTPAAG